MGEMTEYFQDFPEKNSANRDPSGNFTSDWRDDAERQRAAFAKPKEDLGAEGSLREQTGRQRNV